MNNSSTKILSIYNSRNNLLEILSELKYDINDYKAFNINEVDAMYNNNQLDMILNHNDGRKIFIKYYLKSKQMKKNDLDDIIEDLYQIETILEKKDTLIIITEDEPNETITAKVKYLFDQDNIFIVMHNIKRLQFNILKHTLVPTCSILNTTDTENLKKTYNLKTLSQLPEISRFDPQALAICLRPGEVCKYERKSVTAMNTTYYRICV
jgi:DNA-directed RNA polymerase subunit H (RpoH/RPB5)